MSRRSRNTPSTSNNDLSATESDSNGEEFSGPFRIQQPHRQSRGNNSCSSRNDHDHHVQQKQQQQTKWLSRNAIMARENRRKKKLYISTLEQQNSKLKNQIKQMCGRLDSQSHSIANLRNEIRYLKSVLANSSDLCRLMQTINANTGMSVTASSCRHSNDEDLVVALNENCNVPKRAAVSDPRQEEEEDKRRSPLYNNQRQVDGAFVKPKGNPSKTKVHSGGGSESVFGADDDDCYSTDGLLDFDLDDPFLSSALFSSDQLLLDDSFLQNENSQQQELPQRSCSNITTATNNDPSSAYSMSEEHNYYYHAFPSRGVDEDVSDLKEDEDESTTGRETTNQDEMGGICLHVSNRKVSIEFCSGCNASARRTWKMQENCG